MKREYKKKTLLLEVEFEDFYSLGVTLQRIKRLAQSGVYSYKEKINNLTYHYDMDYEWKEDLQYRIEEINGKECIILPSKLNGMLKTKKPN